MVDPQKVASKVLNAIEREKEEVFLSFRDFIIAKIGSLLSPTISKLYGFR
jgi:short-subunit dehydrogenase